MFFHIHIWVVIISAAPAPSPESEDDFKLAPFSIVDNKCSQNCECPPGEIRNVWGLCVATSRSSKYIVEYYEYDNTEKNEDENGNDEPDIMKADLAMSDISYKESSDFPPRHTNIS